MVLLCNQQSFICTHIDYCHPHCYLHHSRSCARLVRAIKLLYGDTVDSLRENSTLNSVARGKKQKEVSRWEKQVVWGLSRLVIVAFEDYVMYSNSSFMTQ